MNNYHSKQKEKNSFKSSIKRFNNIGELDTNVNSFYCYVNPFGHKSNHTVTSSDQIETNKGIIVLDYSNGFLCGIEIVDAAQHVDLKGLGIVETQGINRGEVDGNK